MVERYHRSVIRHFMKLAFLHTDNVFTAELLREFNGKLPEHQILPWIKGEDAPAFDLDIVLVMGEITREQMESQPKLALIQTTTAGYEGVDIDAASELGIWVSFCPSDATGNAVSVAEFAVLLMIAASRHLNQALRSMQDQSVEAPRLNPALSGKTVCIVGLGGIGQLLIERLRPFGMRMLATANHPENAPEDVQVFPSDQMNAAFAQADYVVLCVPASPENENMVNAETLAAMKHGATLINIARGVLVDENALYAAVKSGQIAAAGLDVSSTESTDEKNPLLEFPQVLMTPHIAGATDLMLHGTVTYIEGVVGAFAEGKKSTSFLNAPEKPRRALRESA